MNAERYPVRTSATAPDRRPPTGGGFVPTTLLGLVVLLSDAVDELARRSGAPVAVGAGTRVRRIAVGASVDVWNRTATLRRVATRAATLPAALVGAPLARRVDDWQRVGTDVEDAARESAAHTLDIAVTAIVDRILDHLDITDVAMRRIDLDTIIRHVDIDSILDRVDIDVIVDRLDLNDIARNKLDLRPIVDDVLSQVDYGEVVQSATRGVTGGTVSQMRRRAARYDGIVDRMLGRTKPGELVLPPRVIDPDELVEAETDEGILP